MSVDVEPVRTTATPWSWRAPALVVFAIVFTWSFVETGIPKDPYRLFGWLWVATIAYDIRAPWRSHLRFLRDWWPAFLLLVLYLYSRGLSDELIKLPVHWTMPIRVDEWLGAGTLPTERLQDAQCQSPCGSSSPPRWYDVLLSTIYYTHFVAGLTIAVVLWLRDRALWLPWMTPTWRSTSPRSWSTCCTPGPRRGSRPRRATSPTPSPA
jgi:hypothetical protein